MQYVVLVDETCRVSVNGSSLKFCFSEPNTYEWLNLDEVEKIDFWGPDDRIEVLPNPS